MKLCHITLLRHGLCEGETEGRYIGHTDVPLTDEGRAQLLQMQAELSYPQPDALFVSPLRRCSETAGVLYPKAMPIALDGLKEYFFGEFENKTPAELESHPLFHRWIAGEPDVVPPFAETLENFQTRLCDTFTRVVDGLLKTKTKHAVIITHGGVIMALLAMFGLPEAPMHEWLTPGGCGFTLRVEPSIWSRGRKLEVFAQAPEEPQEDRLPEERLLWKELEDTSWT